MHLRPEVDKVKPNAAPARPGVPFGPMTPRQLLSAVAAAVLLGAAACTSADSKKADAPAASAADRRFDTFKEQFIERLWRLNPDAAAYQGYHKYDNELVVNDSAWRAGARAQYARELGRLGEFPLDSLSAHNQTDHRMLADFLRGAQWSLDSLRAWAWDPSSYNLGDPIGMLLNGRHAPLNKRLLALSDKLSHATAYYEAATRNLRHPSVEHVRLAVLQNNGTLELLPQVLDSVEKSTITAFQKERLRQQLTVTRTAIEGYVKGLETSLTTADPAARSYRLGPALYARKFHHDLTSAYTPDQLYQRAVAHKEELLRDMETLSRELWPKYCAGQTQPTDRRQLIRQVIDKLTLNHTTPDSFVVAVRRQIPRLVKFVDEKRLLTQDPSKPLVVRETPLYMRGGGAGASISAPGPYDKGADTYYNVSPITPADYSPEAAESYLREYNRYTLQILNIHEAIPGHYTQLVYANRSPSLVKAIFGNGSMVEGWAVYSERMMLENGYGATVQNGKEVPSPELWLLYYKWNLRTTLNTILDISVHTKNMSQADGLALLMNDGFQERAEAEGKWRRVQLSQVQLCSYFDGYSQIMDLREELKAHQGKTFDLRTFHEQFLSYGSAPVRYIRNLMLARTAPAVAGKRE